MVVDLCAARRATRASLRRCALQSFVAVRHENRLSQNVSRTKEKKKRQNEFSFRIELPNDRAEMFIRAIETNADPQMDLVCCILTNDRKDRYDAIKKVLCVDCPIPSQVN